MVNLHNSKIGFIGGGNMAQALAKGFIDADIINEDHLYCSTPNSATNFKNIFTKSNVFTNNYDIFVNCDVIILAVKPQYFYEAICRIASVDCNPLIISIMAGITLENLNECPKLVRVMTNTPSLVKKAISVYSLNFVDIYLQKVVFSLFSCVGICEEVPESLMNAYGGFIGSGPAYVFIIIEALADGAVKMGIPRQQALKFAAHLLSGSAELLLASGKHPGELKDSVCSPQGTTIYAVHELEKSGIRAALMSAVEASTKRSKELAAITSAHTKKPF